jgi:hypothetical protein
MSEVGRGVLEGGWEYVRAAYLVTLVILGSYVVSVVLRLRAEERRRERAAGRDRSRGPA